jgi:hypothetical protein
VHLSTDKSLPWAYPSVDCRPGFVDSRSIHVRRSIFRTVSQGTSISQTVRQGIRLMISSLSRACSASVRASCPCSPCSLRWKEAAGSVHARGGNGRNARVGGREGACKAGWELEGDPTVMGSEWRIWEPSQISGPKSNSSRSTQIRAPTFDLGALPYFCWFNFLLQLQQQPQTCAPKSILVENDRWDPLISLFLLPP